MGINELDLFLKSQNAFSAIKLHGFLTAINSSPSLIMASEWLPLCGIQEIAFESTKQAENILGMVLLLHNDINISLRESKYKPLLYLPTMSSKDDNLSLEKIIENLKLWAEGYWVGVEATWPFDNNRFDAGLNGSLGMIYLLTLSKEEFLKEWIEIGKELVGNCKNTDLKDYYQLILSCLPSNVIQIYEFWLKRKNDFRDRTVHPTNNKIGRNDICPCGSGKKYKQCCLH